MLKICKGCGITFEASGKTIFHSEECKKKAWKRQRLRSKYDYSTGDNNCSNCFNMGDDGECSVMSASLSDLSCWSDKKEQIKREEDILQYMIRANQRENYIERQNAILKEAKERDEY